MDAHAPEVTPLASILFFVLISEVNVLSKDAFYSSFLAKTFLGTFRVDRPPHDPAFFRSATMHEIQREIIQLVRGLHKTASSVLISEKTAHICVSFLCAAAQCVVVSSPRLQSIHTE